LYPAIVLKSRDRQTKPDFEMFATGEALMTNLPRPASVGCLKREEQGAKAEKDYGLPPNPKPLKQTVWDFFIPQKIKPLEEPRSWGFATLLHRTSEEKKIHSLRAL
jgi:hypothetical protein